MIDLVSRVLKVVDNFKAESEAPGTEVSPQQVDAAVLWDKAASRLEKALAPYDKMESGAIAENALVGESRASCQKEIDKIIDAALFVLEDCGAMKCRHAIRVQESKIAEAMQRIAEYQEERMTAPSQATLSLPSSIWTRSRESLEAAITAEEIQVAGIREHIDQLKQQFRIQLAEIGIEIGPDEIDAFLLPVTQDDIVSMAAVISHIRILTEQLERLTEASSEAPAQARRYYGMFVLLMYAVDRLQRRFIHEIDSVQLPKLSDFEEEARKNISEAKRQLERGGPREQLKANIAAAETAVSACRILAQNLREQRDTITRENRQTNALYQASRNTYKVVRLGQHVADVMRDCRHARQALKNMQLPRLRPFENLQLKEELQRLSERMLEKESR